MRRSNRLLSFMCFMSFAACLIGAASPTHAQTPKTGEPDVKPSERVLAFARQLLQADAPDFEGLLTEQVAQALNPDQAKALRGQLAAQRGAVQSFGDSWIEEEGEGLVRHRLPVTFERGELDLQVVLNDDLQVAGVFFAAHQPRPEEVAADAPEGGRALAVEFGDPTPLPGVLELPAGDGPFPAVILVHGSGPNDRDERVGPNRPFRDISHGLVAEGIAVLRYDKRSHAAPQTLVAKGTAMTVEHEVMRDVWAGLDLLRGRADIDADRLFIVGHSLGGMLAPRMADREPHPAGIVSLAGLAEPLDEAIVRQSNHLARTDGDVSEDEQRSLDVLAEQHKTLRAMLSGARELDPAFTFLGIGAVYYRDLASYDPPAVAAAAKRPILIVHGGRDYQVDDISWQAWQQALGKTPFACLRGYPALDHLLRAGEGPSTPASYQEQGAVSTDVIDDVAAWILTGRCVPETKH